MYICVLLAVKPEWNNYIYAMSLMAPIAYLEHCTFFIKAASAFDKPLNVNFI